jgi:hypothetical protein
MPIKGLTDRGFVSFPKIGDIRKGAEKETNRPGKDLTYFRAVFPEDESDAAAAFYAAYGDEPREINILLPFDSIEQNWETWQEEYTASALQHRCDGETCVMWRDDDGEMQYTAKPCPGGCEETGRLKIIVPELRRLAYLVVHTTGIWDLSEITANLNALKALTRNGIKGIPLVLKRRPRMVSTPRANGKRVRQEKWMLSVEADQAWVEQQLQAMTTAALPAPPMPQAEAEAVLAESHHLLHDGEQMDSVTGEVVEGVADWDDFNQQDAEPPEPPEKKELVAAMGHILDSGKVLGTLNDRELGKILEQIDELSTPTEKMLVVKGHVEVLLSYLAAQQAESEAKL